jgi:hypothetical protein
VTVASALRPIAAVALAAALGVASAACSGGGSRTTTAAAATTAPEPRVSHDAPELEALLPARVAGVRLARGSTTGARVLRSGNAFGETMERLLAAAGKAPADLRFANAQDPKGTLDLEVGVFAVDGMSAGRLRKAIVASSRPNAPGLTATASQVGGKPVTLVVYPGGMRLYLYEHGEDVFYVGTQRDRIAAEVLRRLP